LIKFFFIFSSLSRQSDDKVILSGLKIKKISQRHFRFPIFHSHDRENTLIQSSLSDKQLERCCDPRYESAQAIVPTIKKLIRRKSLIKRLYPFLDVVLLVPLIHLPAL
jgi:hypothetical protein